MFRYLFWCSVLSISLTFGTNTTLLSKVVNKHSSNNSNKTSYELHTDINQTTAALMSEGGGAIIQNTSPYTLLNDTLNLTIPLGLDSEKTIRPTKSKVTPRKGVNYTAEMASATNATKTDTPINTQNKTKLSDNHRNHTYREHVVPKNVSETNITKLSKEGTVNKSETAKPKKPNILSSKEMDEDVFDKQFKMPAIISSSKTLTADQVPSPKESGPTTQIHPISTNRHPDMIMPVVITILVVPMFAVLGFMALRRGQEAWKNRHYKRMDFLLDGMYND